MNEIKTILKIYEGNTPNDKSKLLICKEKDLVLDNFGELLAGIFRARVGGDVLKNVTMTDTGNVARTMGIYGSAATAMFNYWRTSGMYVGVGTGITAPTRADYNLETQVEGWNALGADATYDGVNGRVAYTGSVLMTADRVITEAGTMAEWRNTGGLHVYILLFRDTFSGVSVANGKFAVCSYVLQL